MTDINIGQLSEAINDKMDRDANNIESPKLPVFLVAKQDPNSSNNYTWYRKWSDGWVEQGGTTGANSDSQYSFTLPVAMANANYQVLIGVETTNTSGAGYAYIGIRSKSTTSITLWSNTSYISKKHWTVIGMAA